MNKIKKAVSILKKGGLVIYPTETCYGLGADATSQKAVKKVYLIKKRPRNKPISIVVSDIKMFKKYAYISKKAEKLIKKYMPGPLTLVLKKKNLPNVLSKNKIGIRIPNNKIALKLIKEFGKPITATSANLAGGSNPYTIKSALKQIKPDYYIDAGKLPRRKPSTIYDVEKNRIIRKGSIRLQ